MIESFYEMAALVEAMVEIPTVWASGLKRLALTPERIQSENIKKPSQPKSIV